MLLEVENLRTYFYTRSGVIRAVNDVSFSLSRGETLGIVGESGSGKSVTCYSLLGLIPKPPGKIVSGQANFGGVDLLNCPEEQLRRIEANAGEVLMRLGYPLVTGKYATESTPSSSENVVAAE